jgi:hypothetical protein
MILGFRPETPGLIVIIWRSLTGDGTPAAVAAFQG